MKRGLLMLAAALLAALTFAVVANANLDAGYTAHTAASVGDCNDNGIPDGSESFWGNRDDDGDGLCNGVDGCPYEASAAYSTAECQMQAITVPESPSDPSIPHPTYSGAAVRLAGIARYGGNQFSWDFGDGSAPTAWAAFANPWSDLSVVHTYTGPAGKLFSATLSVRSSANPSVVATATYPVKIYAGSAGVPSDPAQLDVRARMAADRALWYLHQAVLRGTYSDGAPGYRQPYGVWPAGDLFASTTCAAVDAFERAGHLPQDAYDTDPYVEDVQRGLAAILAGSATAAVNAAFDMNANGTGAILGSGGQGFQVTYAASCALALADSRAAGRIATTGLAGIYGKAYSAIGQDAADWLGQTQLTANYDQGSWPPSFGGAIADIDTGLWPVLALQASADAFGTTVPVAVRAGLAHWLVAERHTATDPANGAWMLFNAYALPSLTAGGIAAHRYEGDSAQHPDVQAGLGFLYRDWLDTGTSVIGQTTSSCWTANLGNGSTMQAVSRVLSDGGIARINDYDYTSHVQRATSFDWYHTPPGQSQTGYATYLVSRQSADGSWQNATGCDTAPLELTTAYGLLTLHTSLVADAGGPYVTDVNKPVTFDATASYDAAGNPLTYEWDFDYDGSTFDAQATGPTATLAGGYPTYTANAQGVPLAGGPTHTVAVRVTNSLGQQMVATAPVQVMPVAVPTASAGGPYLGTVNAPVQLDASASSDADGDPLTYAWDLNNDGSFTDATGAKPIYTWSLPGTYAICVQVTDHPDQNPTPSTAVAMTVQACTTVQVGAHRPVANAGGPYSGAAGSSMTLDGSGSSDPDGTALTYHWDLTQSGLFNDSTLARPTYTIPASAAAGSVLQVCLKVTNAASLSNVACTTVTVLATHHPPACTIVSPSVVASNTGGLVSVTADGSRSSDLDGLPVTYRWTTTGPPLADPSAGLTKQTFDGAGAGPRVSWTNTLTVDNGYFTTSCTQSVDVLDDAPPHLSVPSSIVLEAGSGTAAAVTGWLGSATASDPAALPGTQIPVANDFRAGPGIAGVGVDNTVTVTWSATNPYVSTAVAQGSATVRVVDTTPPVLSLPSDFSARSSTPTYSATAHDFVDGDVPVTCAPASGTVFPPGNTTVSCSARDSHGNVATGSFVVSVDSTPPVIEPVVTGTLGLKGYYTSDVVLTWRVSDGESDITSVTGCGDEAVTTDTNGTPFTCTATSAGGTASATYTVLRDTTPPSITDLLTPAPNSAGWNDTDTTASFACDDTGSGVADCPAPVVFHHGANQHDVVAVTDRAGNSRTFDVQGVNVDEVAPTLSGSATTAPNANGWYRGDVTVHWACSDDLSGIAGGCPPDSTIGGEGAGLRATSSVTDVAGNTTSAKSAAVQIDRTPPVTHASTPPQWSNASVVVTLTAADTLSGVAATSWSLDGGATQDGTSVVVAGEGVHTLSFRSEDLAGNIEPTQTLTVRIDSSAPTITHTLDPAPNAAGWNASDVRVAFSCADALSGIASCSIAQLLGSEGRAQPVTGHAVDEAGNAASDTAYVSIDKTPPTIAAAPDRDPNANGWYDADVRVGFTCNDLLSGIAVCPPVSTVREGAAQHVSGTATDMAGNSASTTRSGLDVDETPPTVAFTGGGTYTVAQTVTITCTPTDALSGVASSTCPAAAVTAPAWTFGLGATTRTATATDRAGNTASGSVTFTVGVTCGSLKTLVGQWVTNASVVAGLDDKIDAICAAPTGQAKNGKLGAFDNQVEAQVGKSVTAARAKLLEQYAATL